MRHFFFITLLFFFSCVCFSKPHAKPIVKSSQARYWTWVGYNNNRDWEAYFSELKSVGIEGVLIQSGRDGLEKVIPIADKYGIEVQAWLWVMNNGGIGHQHPEWLDYNANGESLADSMAYVGYYKFLNPAIPEVRALVASYFEDIARTPGLDGISMDYCRYVDAILPEKLWPSYGIVQDKVYPKWDYGYHPAMIAAFEKKYGYDPRTQSDPVADKKWLNFRCDVLSDFVDSLAGVIHANGLPITASPFPTPKMSKQMVRQDWGRWPLDMAFPMIYHGFYEGGDLNWIAQCVKDCKRDAKPQTRIFYGMHIPDFNNPNGPTLTQAIETAIANGVEGFSMYTFDSLSPQQKEELRNVIQKLNSKKQPKK